MLLHPSEWKVDGEIVGAEAVYRQIRTWLEGVGIRLGAPGTEATAVAPAGAEGVDPTAVAAATGGRSAAD
jgi:hypothetical protein